MYTFISFRWLFENSSHVIFQAAKQSLGIHTTIAEMVKDKITESELMDTLEVEQEILSYVNSDK